MTERQTKTERREVRLTERDNNLLIEAAGLAGMSVSEFVVEHAVTEAEALVRAHHTIELSEDNFRRFIAALDDTTPNRRFTEVARSDERFKHAD